MGELNQRTGPTTDHRPLRWELAAAAGTGWALHAATLGNFLYTHDGWNDVLLGDLVLSGGLEWHENILRLLVTLSFGLRALADTAMWAWHLPNVLAHGVNAALVLVLALRMDVGRWAARAAAILFASAPLLCHPVEWIGGGYDLFATLGILGASVALLHRRPWLAAALGLIALTSKETGATVAGVGLALCLAAEGLPEGRRAWMNLARLFAPLAGITAVILLVRVAQVQSAPVDAMAGRSVQVRPAAFAVAAPAAVGIAASAGLAEVVELRDPTTSATFGWVALGALLIGIGLRRREARLLGGLLAAGGVALVPVSLIAMDLQEMVDNARYLYLTAAVTAPILPALILGPGRAPHPAAMATVLALLGVSLWGGVERVSRSVAQDKAVAPVAREVLSMAPGGHVIVLTNLYDEATARFLMSQWLATRRRVRAEYVMRGTWIRYTRRGGGATDAAEAYFGPAPRPLTPAMVPPGASVLLQSPNEGTVERIRLPAGPGRGPFVEVAATWTALPPPDPEDDPIEISDGGRTLHASRFLGPVATAEVAALATLPLPAGDRAISAIRLSLRVDTQARPRYGTGYHDRFGALFWGDQGDTRRMVSFPLDRPGPVELRLDIDPVAVGDKPTHLGLMPLNYPGRVTVERVEIAR